MILLKNAFRISGVILLILIFISCKKEEAPPTSGCDDLPLSLIGSMYPTIYYPASGSAVPSTSLILRWGNRVYVDWMMCTYTVYFGTNPNDLNVIASDQTQDSIKLNGLLLNLAYYWKVIAKYKWGIDCNSTTTTQILSFIPVQTDCPYVITEPVLTHDRTPPRVGGNVLYEGSLPLIERGVFWSQSPNAELNGNKFQIGDRLGLFTALLPGLNPSTTYYLKAYASNSHGTSVGSEISFTTGEYETFQTVSDFEGNVYYAIKIGSQVWMAENLRTTKFNDGTLITNAPEVPSGSAYTSPGYRWYKDDIGFNTTYGAYYNALAIDTSRNGNKNVCPTGWHVPVETEWDTLITYLGGEGMAGGKLKETGNYFWQSAPANWTWATNESGFTALPGGYCDYANCYDLGMNGYWWSGGSTKGYKILYLDYRNPRAEVIGPLYIPTKEYRFYSVRCLKDN